MGFNVSYSAPPWLQGFAAYYGGQQAAERQTENTQSQIDAQNSAQLNNAIANSIGSLGSAAASGYHYGQAQENLGGQYAADGMGPPTPGDPQAYERNMLMSQYFMGGPQAASGYMANQEQFRNRLNIQNDAQSFQGEQNRLSREQNQSQFDARIKARNTDREDQQAFQKDFYTNTQAPTQLANSLGTTVEGLSSAGREIAISRGMNPDSMTAGQINDLGAQAYANIKTQRAIQGRVQQAVAVNQQRRAGKVRSPNKIETESLANLDRAESELQFNPMFTNLVTGEPTEAGVIARKRIETHRANIESGVKYKDPPPTLGESLGLVRRARGPTQDGSQFESLVPGGKLQLSGNGIFAMELPNGKMLTMHDKNIAMRMEDVDTAQSKPYTPGEIVSLDGKNVGTINEKGGTDYYPPHVMELLYPNAGSGSGGTDVDAAKKMAMDAFFKASGQKRQVQMEDGSTQTVNVGPAEAAVVAKDALDFAQEHANQQVSGSDNDYKDIVANHNYDVDARANKAIQMMAAGKKTIDDFRNSPPSVFSAIQSRIPNAGMNNLSNRITREYQKVKGGPVYVGEYDPSTKKIYNERLK